MKNAALLPYRSMKPLPCGALVASIRAWQDWINKAGRVWPSKTEEHHERNVKYWFPE